MATRYVEALREVQPEGPYHLGGWSMGGIVAFEMALQLKARGHEVATLAIIDAHAPRLPAPARQRNDGLNKLAEEAASLPLFRDALAGTAGPASVAQVATLLELLGPMTTGPIVEPAKVARPVAEPEPGRTATEGAGALRAGPGLSSRKPTRSSGQALASALRQSCWPRHAIGPGHYDGQVVLFRAAATRSADHSLGWGQFASEVESHELAGDHVSILKPPVVSILARALLLAMHEAGGPARPGPRGGLEKLPMVFMLRLLLAQHLVHLFEGITFDAWLEFASSRAVQDRSGLLALRGLDHGAQSCQFGRGEGSGAPVWRRDRGGARGGADLYPGPLPQRHDSSSRAAGDRPSIRVTESIPDIQSPHLPAHRALAGPSGRAVHVAPPGSGRRSGLHGPYPAIAIHGLVLPSQPARLSPLSHVSRRPGLGSRGVVECLAILSEGRHAQDRPSAHSQITTAYSPGAPDPERLPDRSLHSHQLATHTRSSPRPWGCCAPSVLSFGFNKQQAKSDRDRVLETYTEMYEAYFADRALVPPGQLVEIAYEDLERDRMGQLEMIYERLNLGDFKAGPPRNGAIPRIDRPLPEEQPSPARRTDQRANCAGLGP